MKLIPIQRDILINPERISVIKRGFNDQGEPAIKIVIDEMSYEVTEPFDKFMASLSNVGVDLTKQFFAV